MLVKYNVCVVVDDRSTRSHVNVYMFVCVWLRSSRLKKNTCAPVRLFCWFCCCSLTKSATTARGKEHRSSALAHRRSMVVGLGRLRLWFGAAPLDPVSTVERHPILRIDFRVDGTAADDDDKEDAKCIVPKYYISLHICIYMLCLVSLNIQPICAACGTWDCLKMLMMFGSRCGVLWCVVAKVAATPRWLAILHRRPRLPCLVN